jgi:hypothetical protein
MEFLLAAAAEMEARTILVRVALGVTQALAAMAALL